MNSCRNPTCANFGVHPSAHKKPGRRKAGAPPDPDSYRLSGGSSSKILLVCNLCGETLTLRSNQAVVEELNRMLRVFQPTPAQACPRENCSNPPIGSGAYYSYGKTKAGAARYQCKLCGKTFSVSTQSTRRQKRPEVNAQVFTLLVNKSPLRRICEVVQIHPVTLYSKIDFAARQSELYASRIEAQLLSGKQMGKLYLSVDRQEHIVNWGTQLDRRNVAIHTIATADNQTGFVFGVHVDYDPDVNIREVELDALEIKDREVEYGFRKYARLWLPGDGDDELRQYVRAIKGEKEPRSRLVPEDAEDGDGLEKLPAKGAKVRSGYTMAAHFFYLSRLIRGAEKIRFFMDNDSGIRAACLMAFQQEIRGRRADAFLVRINKDLKIDQKRSRLAQSKLALERIHRQKGAIPASGLVRELMKENLHHLDRSARWNDRWVLHPAPDMGEPEKSVCYLTDFDDYDEDHLAQLYLKATLRGIDRYFMQVRRRVMMLERPLSTASASRRVWHGYSAYDPAVACKLQQIFRVYYNYCLAGADKKTPAMRIGLTDRPIKVAEILALH